MSRTATILLDKPGIGFSAAHFTIFSETERERLHGHSFRVALELVAEVNENGLCFDYKIFKKKLLALCDHLDEHMLLPEKSPFLKTEKQDDMIIAHFNGEKIPFLEKDVCLLPICNITVECLSEWFMNQLLLEKNLFSCHLIEKLTVRVYSGEGQWGATSWQKNKV